MKSRDEESGMSKTAIDALRTRVFEYPDEWVHRAATDKGLCLRMADVLREVDAIIAERDALKARLTQPTRKLREVKGVTYDATHEFPWRVADSAAPVGSKPVCGYKSVSSLLYHERSNPDLTDADHAAIYALREQPYEPVERVEDVLAEMIAQWVRDNGLKNLDEFVARIRAAVAAEGAPSDA